jgi:uncharacterized phiE125 gp8 family phage protein
MLDLRLVTPASESPVALDIARQHCRVASTDEDVVLTVYLAAATQAVEEATGRALLPQVWDYRPAPGCGHVIRLPHAPVAAIQQVASIADDGTETSLEAASFTAVLPSGPTCGQGVVTLLGSSVGASVRIRYRAGYPVNQVPPALHAAILLLTGSLYENREAESERSGAATRALNTNPTYERLLAPYRLIG